MLTRLYVSGFKNLVETEVRFGPLTCIAGRNGVGKSNIFDAIQFLALLADHPFVEAASATRGGGDLVELFTSGGDGVMSFECDILIPSKGLDDFNQQADATETFLTYKLTLKLEPNENGLPRICLTHESLLCIPHGVREARLCFDHGKIWRDSVLRTNRVAAPFIHMGEEGDQHMIRLMRDQSGSKDPGKPKEFRARSLPRTVLSAAQNADETPTAVLTRAEMRSWRILHLEPSALRQPDDFQAPNTLGNDGCHLPATLYRLASQGDPSRVYAETANRLSDLVEGVRTIHVDRDDARRVFRLIMTDRAGVALPASSLSDGTLRFIALSVLERDPQATGLICLEEPENGIHPERMKAMMRLLEDMATDTVDEVDEQNPLRQIIVSTHSPVVAAHARRDDLVFAGQRDAPTFNPGQLSSLIIKPVKKSWRDTGTPPPIASGAMVQYLGALAPSETEGEETVYHMIQKQMALPFGEPE